MKKQNLKEIHPNPTSSIDILAWRKNCYDAMNDDFNTPILIAQLFEGVRFINLLKEKMATLTEADLFLFSTTINSFIYDVLGLDAERKSNDSDVKLSGVVEMLIGMRNEARANKDFKLSDQIRDQLIALGIQLKDGKEGTTFSL